MRLALIEAIGSDQSIGVDRIVRSGMIRGLAHPFSAVTVCEMQVTFRNNGPSVGRQMHDRLAKEA